jgi:hypothetical protein
MGDRMRSCLAIRSGNRTEQMLSQSEKAATAEVPKKKLQQRGIQTWINAKTDLGKVNALTRSHLTARRNSGTPGP